jgi:hypothetical protein
MGDVFENDPFGQAMGSSQEAGAESKGLKGLARRFAPPSVDPELYEM